MHSHVFSYNKKWEMANLKLSTSSKLTDHPQFLLRFVFWSSSSSRHLLIIITFVAWDIQTTIGPTTCFSFFHLCCRLSVVGQHLLSPTATRLMTWRYCIKERKRLMSFKTEEYAKASKFKR